MKDSFVGQEIDGYRIQEVLGQGGMGVVYKAENMSLNRIEALKVITPLLVQDAQFLRRFKREAQALARIHHPNIVTVYTLRHAEVGYYLTMEYVEGHTLADRLVEGRGMDWDEALPIVKQLLAAFDFAHRRGIIHRDIKPRNIMLTTEQVVKVMDFGLAKFYQQHDVTRTQGVSGTLCYMSPEQVKGHQNLDQRSDIFSLGMTLYEVLSGCLPFDKNDSQFNIQRSIVEDEFPALHRLKEGIPARLSAVVMKAIHKEPAQRYQYARDMLAAVEAFEATVSETQSGSPSEAVHVGKSPAVTRQGPATARWKTWAVGAALVGGMAWAAWAFGPALYERVGGAETAASVLQHKEDAAAASGEQIGASPDASAQQEDAAQQPLAETPEQNPPDDPPADRATDADSGPGAAGRDQPLSEPSGSSLEAPGRADNAPAEAATDSAEPTAAEQQDANPEDESNEEERPRAEEQPVTPSPEQQEEAPPTSGAPDQEANRSDEDPPVEAEAEADAEDRTEAEISPADQVRRDVVALQGRLQQAIMDQEWTGVPVPLADYYGELLDDFYSRFSITKVESTAGEPQADGATVVLPVTVYISYRQRGREGIKALPIPATWVWEDSEAGLALRRVHEP
ncbi:MAG: protein kinase [Bacteroidetes bacterium]|jgi:hypothetical protein|nr:protein kinase [Bacteroidota bacterium]